MSILIAAIHAFVLVLVARQARPKQGVLRRVFWPAFVFKIGCGLLLGVLYTYYYDTGDTFNYFRDAGVLTEVARIDFLSWIELLFTAPPEALGLQLNEPRAIFLTRIASFFDLISNHHYWVISAWFSTACFFASWYLVQTLHKVIPSVTVPAILAFLFFPSATFWSSGLIKESLAMAGLFVLAALVVKLWAGRRPSIAEAVVGLGALWITWNLKYYYLAVFVPIAVALLIYRRAADSVSPSWRWTVWGSAFLVLLSIVAALHPNFSPDRLLHVIADNNAVYQSLSAPGDYVEFEYLTPSAISMLRYAPKALVSGLFRPMPWEASNGLQILASLENLLLLGLLVGAVWRWKAAWRSPYRTLAVAVIVYIAVLCIFLTISAPNFGTLSRYRVGYVSFFAVLLLANNPAVDFVGRFVRRLARH